MAVKPITGMLRRGLLLDIGIALTLGGTMGTFFWHGWHLPRTFARDNYYKELEAKRAARAGQ